MNILTHHGARRLGALVLFVAAAGLFPSVAVADEVLSSPHFVSAAVMPNGHVGLLFLNDGPQSEIRFKRHTSAYSMDPSQRLSTAAPWYPQLATFQGRLVAAYVDNRLGENYGKLIVRVSDDSGDTWGDEFYPFGAETFAQGGFVPRVVATRDGQQLYVFTAVSGARPRYRFTSDPDLATWTAPADAGDGTMRTVSGNNCGAAGPECYRAHAFGFMETATPGRWVYIAKSDAGFGQSGRGTQVGTLGGSWSVQVDHGGSGGLTGNGGESTATTFLDRAGNVYYLRAYGRGEGVYLRKSLDGGLSWGPKIDAYNPSLPALTGGAPVGLYVPQYGREYVWYHGWGGRDNAVRIVPIWTAPASYRASGTVRLFGNEVPDFGTPFAHTFGRDPLGAYSPDPVNLATGSFTAHAEDLTLPGRLLPFNFTRWYNSADPSSGPLGPGWTHSYYWTLTDQGATVEIRRGDGRRDTFARSGDGSYRSPPGVFDGLVKNGDGSWTLTLTDQVRYEFSGDRQLVRIREPAGNQVTLDYSDGYLTTITDTVGRPITLEYTGDRLTALQDAIGRRLVYDYDAQGRLQTVIDKIGTAPGQDPDRHKWQYEYELSTQHLTAITDPDGRTVVRNTYDDQGRVINQRDGGNALTQFQYNPTSTVLTDPRLNRTTYTFDSRMRQISESTVVSGVTRTITYTYDAAGNRTSMTDRNGNRTDYTYDARGNMLTKTDPLITGVPRYVTAFEYDARNNRIRVTDARGFRTASTYNVSTNVLESVTRPIDATTNAVTKYEYGDPLNPGLATRLIAPRGNTAPTPDYRYATTMSYDGQGNLVTRIDPDGNKTTYVYDEVGRKIGFVDPDGYASGEDPAAHTWAIEYDENDRVVRKTNPLGQSMAYTYDGAGNRTSVTDHNGNVTTYAYDANGRLEAVRQKPDPAGQPNLIYTTTVRRDGNGNADLITQGNGTVTAYAFDELNRTKEISTQTSSYRDAVLADAPLAYWRLDESAGAPAARDAVGTRHATYRGAATTGQPGGIMDVGNRAAAFDGDPNSFADVGDEFRFAGAAPYTLECWVYPTVLDGNYRRILSKHSAPSGGDGYFLIVRGGTGLYAGRAVGGAERNAIYAGGIPANQWTHVVVTYDGTNVRLYTNGILRATGPDDTRPLAFPSAPPFRFGAGGVGGGFAGRIDEVAVYGTALPAARILAHYNAGVTATALTTSYVFDGNGNTIRRTTADGVSVPYQYDALSRPTRTDLAPDTSITFAYNETGQRTRMTDGTGTTTYQYDGLGRTTQVAAPNGTLGYAYDLDGNRTRLSYPGAGDVTYTYSSAGRLQSLTDWGQRTTTYTYRPSGLVASVTYPNTMSARYSYDPAQRLVQITNGFGNDFIVSSHTYALDDEGNRIALDEFVSGITTGDVDHFDFRYDGLNRLLSAAGNPAEAFTFDGASNLRTRSGPAATYTYDGANRLTSDGARAFVWSPADRLVRRGTDAFTYDALGRLSRSTVSAVDRTYSYNGDGLLDTAAAGSIRFLWDSGAHPARLLQAGDDRLIYGLGPLYVVRSDETSYALALDALNSVRAEVGDDGAVTKSFRYAAYGALAQGSGGAPSLLGYTGEFADPSGLLYLRARWYDADVGRFLTSDPAGGTASQPVSLNAYAYAYSNPVRFVDPSGQCPPCVPPLLILAGRGALIGVASYVVGRAVANQLEGKPLTDGLTWHDAAISAAVGAATLGFGSGVPVLGRVLLGAGTAGAGEELSQIVTGERNPSKVLANIVSGGLGGILPGDGVVSGFAWGIGFGIDQTLANDVFSGSAKQGETNAPPQPSTSPPRASPGLAK